MSLAVLAVACDTGPRVEEREVTPADVSFRRDVQPIFARSCTSCHGPPRLVRGLDLTSHAGVAAGSQQGAVVVPAGSDASLLWEMVRRGRMPAVGRRLSLEELQTIWDWIAAGAPDN